ncbi:MAG: phytanoyl-CoA dioxygenase family protein [Saprospiraceae bacterium]|nr:phytanoyl-CoA dioxygenase family protein [Saprospiraceae bacterium]
MISLGKVFRKYTGALRQFKMLYVLNNWLNRHQLQHNRALYQKYGLEKSILSNIGSKDFQPHHEDVPWLDRPNAMEDLRKHPDFQAMPPEQQIEVQRFVEEGFLILKGFFAEEEVDQLNQEVEELLQQQQIDFNYTGRKIMESYKHSATANAFFRNARLLELLNFIMGKPVIPFHTINFIEGSEQRAHSDSIHMTTEPQGYLVAAWIALEDIGPEQGPLVYYPKSHRLPYISTEDYPSGHTKWRLGEFANKRFEDEVERVIEEQQFEAKTFQAQKGDVLLWHANLIHGGTAITKAGATRKSMVAHYFCEDVICYHEISQRPALLSLQH